MLAYVTVHPRTRSKSPSISCQADHPTVVEDHPAVAAGVGEAPEAALVVRVGGDSAEPPRDAVGGGFGVIFARVGFGDYFLGHLEPPGNGLIDYHE